MLRGCESVWTEVEPVKNMKWKKLFICETNKASRGGGRKSPKEPAHISFSSYSGSVSGLGSINV